MNWVGVATRALAALGMLGLLAGCADQPKAVQPAAAAAGTASSADVSADGQVVVHDERSLVFYNSDVFDLTFADALKTRSDQIDVNFAGPTSLNSFPARMNVWLAEVKRSNGEVTVVDPNHPSATRGLFGVGIIFDLIDAVMTMHERQAQSDRLALTHIYNAEIVYDSASGTAREVKFTRRVAPPPAGAPETGPAPTTGPAPITTPVPATTPAS